MTQSIMLWVTDYQSLLYSTRPFLNVMQKKWIAFQLLKVLHECHSRKVQHQLHYTTHYNYSMCLYVCNVNLREHITQIFHGDIKTQNVLLTGWDWWVSGVHFCVGLAFQLVCSAHYSVYFTCITSGMVLNWSLWSLYLCSCILWSINF